MADIGSGLTSFGNDVAAGIQDYQRRYDKQKDMTETVQGYLNVAKSIQTQDPKTGKPKPFFSEDQLQTVQHLLDQHKAYQAGAAASAMGIGKGLLQRAAKVQQFSQGPIFTQHNGVTYRGTPNGDWVPVNVPPRNAEGFTPSQQSNLQIKMQDREARGLAAKQKGLDNSLKSVGLNRAQLFDPTAQQRGYLIDGEFLTPDDIASDKRWKTKDGGVTDFGDPTHVRIGYSAPIVEKVGKKDTVIDKGHSGTVLQPTQLQAYQDAAAETTGPKAVEALKWLRENSDNKLAPRINDKLYDLQKAITEPGVNTVQAKPEGGSSDSGEDNVQATEPLPNTPPPQDSPDDTEE